MAVPRGNLMFWDMMGEFAAAYPLALARLCIGCVLRNGHNRSLHYYVPINILVAQLAARNPTKSAIRAAGTAYLVFWIPHAPK